MLCSALQHSVEIGHFATCFRKIQKTMGMDAGNCEECSSNIWKYKCPGCGIRTCSAACVKLHKQRTDCTGKRNRAEYVRISEMDDDLLISDYNFLEEALRTAESAKRSRVYSPQLLPARKQALISQAKNRWFRIYFLPAGMSKSESNKTYYHYSRKCIYWTVEWRFYSTDVVFLDHKVDEHTNLKDILEKHLYVAPGNSVTRKMLGNFCKEPIQNLQFFLRKERTKGSKNLYYELNITKPLREELANKVLIEYPVIHVVLPDQSNEFEVYKTPSTEGMSSSKISDVNQIEGHKHDDFHFVDGCDQIGGVFNDPKFRESDQIEGMPFKEEEIEEGEIAEVEQMEDISCKEGAHKSGDQICNRNTNISVKDYPANKGEDLTTNGSSHVHSLTFNNKETKGEDWRHSVDEIVPFHFQEEMMEVGEFVGGPIFDDLMSLDDIFSAS